MACCNLKKRKDKDYVISLAKTHSKIHKIDMQVFHQTVAGFGKVWDYEEISEGRSLIDEVIKFRPDKGKRVLQNSGQRKPGAAKSEKSKGQ